jgi:hypothetical protein
MGGVGGGGGGGGELYSMWILLLDNSAECTVRNTSHYTSGTGHSIIGG